HIQLSASAQQIEVDVADTGECKRTRDVGIDDYSAYQAPDAVTAASCDGAIRRFPVPNKIPKSLGGFAQHHVVRCKRIGKLRGICRAVDFVMADANRAMNRRPKAGALIRLKDAGLNGQPNGGAPNVHSAKFIHLLRRDNRAAQVPLNRFEPAKGERSY